MTDKMIGRLALRQEGNVWVAYYALPDTMHDAVSLGSIRIAIIEGSPKRRQAFLDIMRDVVGDIIEEGFGRRPDIHKNKPAPFWERGK